MYMHQCDQHNFFSKECVYKREHLFASTHCLLRAWTKDANGLITHYFSCPPLSDWREDQRTMSEAGNTPDETVISEPQVVPGTDKTERVKKPNRPDDEAVKQKVDALQETSEWWSKSFPNCIYKTRDCWINCMNVPGITVSSIKFLQLSNQRPKLRRSSKTSMRVVMTEPRALASSKSSRTNWQSLGESSKLSWYV